MKTLSLAIISAALVLASCSSSKYTASSEYDDVYYNPNKAKKQAQNAVLAEQATINQQNAISAQPVYQQPAYTEPMVLADENLSDYEKYKLQQEAEMLGESYAPEGSEALYAEQYVEYDTLGQYGQEGAPVIVNNYNYYNDPTDYYYSSNLRRFSDDYYGWNYYDPYYTDMHFYTGSPYSWGISMGWGYPGWGMGYSYGSPHYRPYYGYGMGYGRYYDPWCSWGYGGGYGGYYGGSYWSGYNHGYYNGYHNGYYGNDYYGSSNSRYGRMDNRHYLGYSSPTSASRGSSKASANGDPRYRSRTTASARKTTAASQRQVRSTSSSAAQRQVRSTSSSAAQRQVRTGTNAVQRSNNGTVRTTRTRQQATMQQRSTSSGNRSYTPSYSKPRTSSSSSYNRAATQKRTYTQPSTQNRTTINKSATTPSRSSSSYSRPSSTSRSSSSYSRPSSTSRSSYSRPSSSSSSRSSGSVSRSSGSSSRSSGSVSRSSGSSSRSSGSSSRSSGGSSGGSSSRSSGGGSSSSSRR